MGALQATVDSLRMQQSELGRQVAAFEDSEDQRKNNLKVAGRLTIRSHISLIASVTYLTEVSSLVGGVVDYQTMPSVSIFSCSLQLVTLDASARLTTRPCHLFRSSAALFSW